ncbi:PH domain leucine-rich repeat-containing protein phosphatase 2 [Hylaeus anthracinus]|uniref:PH domain leucine-rich repeat-containing protein phosphatase 2 n=1 Tax=Hylaeus anthracinus TaxID=313031 RepID=UPI0023BA381C|nr:PH domain leucine-rich repeat-containing protein phosphatase 2 [Hylaeus anthracinus]XP_054007051.1 PH domain leucine-rich repeat-containing protein phosphatase 2 [Hylaeus anthracinus]XP_054007052.1 PH domain leucine-rich repeat-containing protein phosphatase 2 [Hylaeus anthracinus]
MVIASESSAETMSNTAGKLRRSRRLSSTRGLKVRASANTAGQAIPRQDLNQKLGLCPIVSRNVAATKGRSAINWELNERISLSSGSSTGLSVRPDVRKGIEFSENRRKPGIDGTNDDGNERRETRNVKASLELMNVSGFRQDPEKKRRGSWSIDVDVIERSSEEANVIKSDSKYEIGIPGDGSSARKPKQRRQLPGVAKAQKSAKNEDEEAANRWGRKKVDKTNDSITKRLELIHELNQKILANYERFQQKSKRKEGKESTEVVPKDQTGRSRAGLDDGKESRKEDRVYAEPKRKSRTKAECVVQKCQDSLRQRKLDINKFTFSKDHCEKLTGSKDRGDASDKKRSTKTLSKSRILPDNENFIMAVKPGFHEPRNDKGGAVARNEYSSRSRKDERRTSVFYANDSSGRHVGAAIKDEEDCLGSSRLYPETYSNRSNEAKIDDEGDRPRCTSKVSANKDEEARDTINGTQGDENRDAGRPVEGSESPAIDQTTALENEILENLDETIERFDNEKTGQNGAETSGEKMDSFSSDSIQNDSPLSGSRSPKVARLQETFNSSWDSGVGVDVGTGSGWVRIHTGIESSLVYLTLDTTAKDVCRDMLLGDDLSLFIQYGGEAGRRLGSHEKPLEIQDQFLQKLGYQDVSRRSRLGVDPELRHLVAFHVGPASPLPDLAGYSRCGYALVLKGLVFPQWKRRPLAVIGSRLFLYPACPESRPEWMELAGGGGAVCYAPSRLGKLVLRITGFPRVTQECHQTPQQGDAHHRETRHLYLGFHHPWDRDLWKSWIKQAIHLSSCPKQLDLSNGGLSRIPDSAVAFPAIEELVLSQNQLTNTNNNLTLLHRFPKLHVLHVDGNELLKIPRELLELRGLTYLNLSDNKIDRVPSDISQLINLKELILDRNGIKDLPHEVGELRNLRNISLAGNCLNSIPSFLNMRALTLTDVLSKTDNAKVYKDERNNQNYLYKVNLRNNQLKGNIILGNYGNLTHLDVSENSIEKLDISALQELRSVRCARNILTELTVCGRNLVSLIAGNNKLKKLTIEPVPINLEHLDVSYNNLDALPEWTPDLPVLRALFASHNALTALPDRLLTQPSRLEVLHLPHNRLQALPPPRKPLNIVHLTLQDNALTALPTSFFANTEKMKVLNLSNNRLSELPHLVEGSRNRHGNHSLEKLYLTANCLTDTALDTLAQLASLRVLHIAYNTLDTLPESCTASWRDLEELVLSGNRLQYLPDNVANLRHLRVLRVHSNRLLTCPTFNKTTSLKVLDLAHNQLDRVNLATLVPPQLQFLDISCNSRLHVDPRQFQVYRSQRPISLVDVSGQNRPSLPSHPHQQEIVSAEKGAEQPWRLGFSETAGSRERLYVSQVRMPSFCNVEGLFGIFDGGSNQEAPSALQEMIPRLLLEERTVRETSKEYLKYTLLSAHRELKEKGQKYGIDATLVHIIGIQSQQGFPKAPTRYSLKVASSGDAKAVLCRAAGPLTLAPAKKVPVKNQLGNAAMFPLVVPDPTFEEVDLEDDDEFVIIANRRLWEVLSVQEAVREARAEASPVLAAKRLQDLAQAYGAEDNLSVVVVRLTGPNQGDLDQLMRELRHAVGKNRGQTEGGCPCHCCVPPAAHKPPGPCCCHSNEGYYLNGVLKNIVNRTNKPHNGSGRYFKNRRPAQENESPPYKDDRSSPSGQSDQASDSTFKSRHPSSRVWSGSAASRATNKARQSVFVHENGTRKVSTSLAAQEDTVSERSGALSEEQFRCWEYMLEQNTQLLFDKELDTLTRTPLRRGQSRSTPQLGGNLPFLSKRFGSARSFNPSVPRPPIVRFGSGRRLLNGGPNAAYFGSLQRLMPYNLEYDFAVIQERNGLDSLEQDATRMQQYWGVATTEL